MNKIYLAGIRCPFLRRSLLCITIVPITAIVMVINTVEVVIETYDDAVRVVKGAWEGDK